MAYAAVASLLQTIDLTLNYHQRSISPEFGNQITSIHQHTCSLRSFMEGSSHRVYNWEETIREVTVRAEDIIELLLSDSLLESSGGSSRSELEKGKCEVLYGLNELEKVRKEIESIASRVKGGKRIKTPVGPNEEVMEMISRLRGGSPSLEIIAICGSSGMGKTRLADKAYRHPLIRDHFDVRLWFTVTRECTLVRGIELLLRCLKANFSTSSPEDELIKILLQILGGRRYLIWLDDVWSNDVLERLKMVLPDYENGSRIIFTTQSTDLASYADNVHEMRLLDDDKGWNLLLEKIFKGDPCPFQLESIGRTIARSCGGHQLSIVVVSGILAFDQTEATWEDVSESIKVASNKIGEILYLSYVYLPHHLRPCLLYFGIYPEGHEIYVPWLMRVWVAEGFVNESSGYTSLEEIGEEYVKDLVTRSLVSVRTRKCDGGIRSITVHDLVRGMCIRRARIDNFNHHLRSIWSSKEIIKSSRRISSFDYCDDFLSGVHGSSIRTLYFSLENDGKLDLRCCMENVRLLRILSLLRVQSFSLSEEVFELFHLRYLALYCNSIIPEAISNLENLQTLVIVNEKIGGVFDKLPEGIWRMPQLRHLRIFSFKFPNEKRPTSAPLESLQTLCTIVNFVCSREILKMFPNLKKLDLVYTENWKAVVEGYELHNLIYLHKLRVLKLQTNFSVGEKHKMSCAFPLTLKKLSLRGLQLCWEDMKMVASLPNLEVLKLRNHACVGETWETSDGGFSRLMLLLIEESNLEKWITKSSHFPRLWRLVLVRCSRLLDVPYEMAEIPTLKGILLDDTNQSLRRSVQRIQQDRHSLGLDPVYVYVE